MELDAALRLTKALADRSRLLIVRALTDGPRCAEEVAIAVGVAPSTVSFHLKKLAEAGVVTAERKQYYSVYRLRPETLALPLSEVVRFQDPDRVGREARAARETRRVVDAFFSGGRLLRLPAQQRKRTMVLEQLAPLFEPGGVYQEREVDELIHSVYDDHCLLRRLLVDEGYLCRAAGVYQRSDKPAPYALDEPGVGRRGGTRRAETPERGKDGETSVNETRKALKRQYKEREKVAGIWHVKNVPEDKEFLGSSLDLQNRLNGQEVRLKAGMHPNKALQADFDRLGREAFVIEVVETVQHRDEPEFDVKRELEKLERRYLAAADPSRTYNRNDHIRFG